MHLKFAEIHGDVDLMIKRLRSLQNPTTHEKNI
jgi:hypothetical protein